MSKIATRYLEIDPWLIAEKGFNPERAKVSESVFSVGNEFMGVRGYFEEGYSAPATIGSYFNGIYEYAPNPKMEWFKGTPERYHFLVNAVDWLYTRLTLDGETLDLGTSKFHDFSRELDMRTGVYIRRFTWETGKGKKLRLTFSRFTSMCDAQLGVQKVTFEALNFTGAVKVEAGLDFNIPQYTVNNARLWTVVRSEEKDGVCAILGQLPESKQQVCATMRLACNQPLGRIKTSLKEKAIVRSFQLELAKNEVVELERIVVNAIERNADITPNSVWSAALKAAKFRGKVTFKTAFQRQTAWWSALWERTGVSIEGDPENEQGVRFGIFQLTQTYHGVDPSNNIAAKGLTSEHYGGYTWWDTETYCLPFYMFTNPKAARNLLAYRHVTLDGALRRSASDDCKGARYPMCTIDGDEACIVWQHGDLEIHVGVAIAYGIWHYVNVTGDRKFLYGQGIEMLLQICRFYASRGGWGQVSGKFGYYGVMGPDEFHMMANNNCYTNFMAMKTFQWTLGTVAEMKKECPADFATVSKKVALLPTELKNWRKIADNTFIPRDPKTGIYEQHEGYFNYPHTEIAKIPPAEFPLYDNWSYYRLFRTDMIKQPDVLLMHFFFSHEFDDANKRANYEYYEARCSHESSLSPGVHSILAAELGMHGKAFAYWGQSARLDLDDYNRNTDKGLHTTSMAAAWLNIVYGFGGLRTDADCLSFRPSLPKKWKSFSFKLQIGGGALSVRIDRNAATFTLSGSEILELEVFGRRRTVTANRPLAVAMPTDRCGKEE